MLSVAIERSNCGAALNLWTLASVMSRNSLQIAPNCDIFAPSFLRAFKPRIHSAAVALPAVRGTLPSASGPRRLDVEMGAGGLCCSFTDGIQLHFRTASFV